MLVHGHFMISTFFFSKNKNTPIPLITGTGVKIIVLNCAWFFTARSNLSVLNLLVSNLLVNLI